MYTPTTNLFKAMCNGFAAQHLGEFLGDNAKRAALQQVLDNVSQDVPPTRPGSGQQRKPEPALLISDYSAA